MSTCLDQLYRGLTMTTARMSPAWVSSPSLGGAAAGIGSTLMRLVEQRARELGLAELALDTSEHATRLMAFYQKRGYRFIELCQWRLTNYRSVVPSAPTTVAAARCG